MTKKRVASAVFALAFIQPIMDVLSYFAPSVLASSVTLLRLAVLGSTCVLGFALARDKRPFFVLFGVLSAFSALHFAFVSVYTDVSLADAVNLVRIYSFFVTAVSLYAVLDVCETAPDALCVGITASLAFICFVMLVSAVTGTDPHTYAGKKIGVLGWFMNTNAQSAIISMALPYTILTATKAKRHRTAVVTAVSVIGSCALFCLATRLAYAAIFGVSAVFFAAALINRKDKDSPSPAVFLVAPVLALLLLPVSPMTENLHLVADNYEDKSEIAESITAVGTVEDLYRHRLASLVDRFGFEKVYGIYSGTEDIKTLTSVRTEKINYSRLLLAERKLCAIFGLDHPSMTWNGRSFDAENDFHGIFFLCGGVGLLLCVAFILRALAPFVFRALRHPAMIGFESAAVFSSVCCGLAHAFFTAGVLRRPNASFYLAASLALLIYMSEKHRYTDKIRN